MRIGPFNLTAATVQRVWQTYRSLVRAELVPHQKASGMELVTQWPSSPGWMPWLRESFGGAWQRGIRVPMEDAITHPTVWSCVTLIAGDIAKMRPMLVIEDEKTEISTETYSAAFSPVIRRPNHYQNRIQFWQYWVLSKLCRGNAYALKERDARGVVTALYLLDPTRVRPMVTPSGDVYYALGQDVLSGVDEQTTLVPAREMIHDVMFPIYHPLVGLSPIFACGHMAVQGLQIVHNTTRMTKNGFQIGGIITAPGKISDENAKRLERYWEENYAGESNIGKIAALGDGMKFEQPEVMSAVDAQIIEQLKWDDEKICSVYHVPPYMVGVGPTPAYNNVEALNQQYYSQCLQILIESAELCMTEGLGLHETDQEFEYEFDLDGLLRMDSAAKMDAITKGVKGGVYTPNEARAAFNRPPLEGGETVYLQQQDYSISALAKRDAGPDPFGTARKLPALPPVTAPPPAKYILLDSHWVNILRALPESGMGYQIVDVRFVDGQELRAAMVFNAQYLDAPANLASVAIEDVRLHHETVIVTEVETLDAAELLAFVTREVAAIMEEPA